MPLLNNRDLYLILTCTFLGTLKPKLSTTSTSTVRQSPLGELRVNNFAEGDIVVGAARVVFRECALNDALLQ